MRTAHLIRMAYRLLWLVLAIAWLVGRKNVTSLPDSRVSLFLIGVLCLGIGFYILLPDTQKKRMTAYRNESNYDFILMAFAEIGLMFLCMTFFSISVNLLEIALQFFISDVEVELLHLLPELSTYTVTFVYMGEVIGFYGINQGKIKFSFLRTLICIALFSLSIMQFKDF
jgi:hypothetical protein